MTVLTAGLLVGEKHCAQAQAIFVRADDVGQWPLPSKEVHAPEDFALIEPSAVAGGVWFRDTVEMRGAKGEFWLRSITPVASADSPMARVCAHADWASGLSRLDTFASPKLGGFPNADLSVHLSRVPVGEWIGLRPASRWFSNGMGMTDTEILDVFGPIGRACHTLVLVPLKKGQA